MEGGGGSMWDTPLLTTTCHVGELWHLLCHFMWHKTYSSLIGYWSSPNIPYKYLLLFYLFTNHNLPTWYKTYSSWISYWSSLNIPYNFTLLPITTRHMGELLHLLCYFMWHKAYSSLIVYWSSPNIPYNFTFPPTTTRHLGELLHLLCHFMWHKTYSSLIAY